MSSKSLPEVKEMCQNCGKREATINWLDHGSIMDFIHGNYQRWCEVCVLKHQIKYNKKQLKELPKKIAEWETRLKELEASE
jgi:hypothetical protein